MAIAHERGGIGTASATHHHGTLREGVVTGVVGAGAVALWFLIVDTLAGRPLYTPALLGAVIGGAADPQSASVAAGSGAYVLLYTLLHVIAFALVGILAVVLVHKAERTPPLVALLLMLFAAVEVAFTGFVALLEVQSIGRIAWYQVALGNVVAALSMGWYLLRAHPQLRAGFGGALAADDGR